MKVYDAVKYCSTTVNLSTIWQLSGQFHIPAATSLQKCPSNRWWGGWVGPGASPEAMQMSKLSCLCQGKKKRQHYPCSRLWRPTGLWDIEAPTFFRQSAHRWRWGQPYAPAALYPPGRFLVCISVRGCVNPRATVRLKGLRPMKNPVTSARNQLQFPGCLDCSTAATPTEQF
jgi:hypothetical protein